MAPYFKYVAKNSKGEEIEKIVKSETPIAIAKKVKSKGYHITEIKKTESIESKKENKNYFLIKKKIDKSELLLFTEQFSVMIGSGLTIVESLLILQDQIKNKHFKKSIKKISQNIEKGSSLSESVKQEKSIFPYFYQQMVKIGEMAGVLPKILKDLSLYYKWQLDIRKKILSSLYYPMLLLGATFVTIIFLLTYVIPSFEDIFQTFNAQLPYPTRVILFLSKNIKKNFIYIILFLIVFILLIRLYFNTDNGSHIRDKLILKLPFISKIKKYIILWRFSNMLNLLIKNGLSLLESLIIVEKITKNRVIKKMIHTIQINIREGQDLSTALSESNFFPKIMIKMINTGEKTGRLEEMLKELSNFFHNKLNDYVKKTVTVLEPILVILMAAIIAFISISVLLPMFNMYSLF